MSTRLVPPTTALSEPYWEAAKNGQLLFQECAACGNTSFPPRSICAACNADALEWKESTGKGTVYTYTIARRAPHPVFAQQCPMVIAVIDLEEGFRMMSNVVNCDPAAVSVGMPVQVSFETIDDSDMVLPVFSAQ